jgi:hypothetical protein
MKKAIIYGTLMFMTTLALFSYDLPKSWFKAGNQPDKYDMGLDKGAGRDGKDVATIKSISNNITGFGTLMQQSLPTNYLGKRVRMTGYMKSVNVEGWAGFWFRVDEAKSTRSLSFDNMHDRAIRATTGWKKYEIVLDVPSNASMLAYGALLNGVGQIWFDNFNFEIVNKNVPTTGVGLGIPPQPQNLNFEK